ncbi:hypothetical protein [Acinetobacter sp. ANC 4640]
MMKIKKMIIGICISTASLSVLAQNSEEYHDHHPISSVPSTTIVEKKSDVMLNDKMGAMDQHMKAMQAIHEQMMSAKNPKERQMLMAEHMKLMQEGMMMMKQMGSQSMNYNITDRQKMMEKRMDMMQSMMQMMMDCMPPSAPK